MASRGKLIPILGILLATFWNANAAAEGCPPGDFTCGALEGVDTTELQCDGTDAVCPVLKEQMETIRDMASGGNSSPPIRLPVPCAGNGCTGGYRRCADVLNDFQKSLEAQATEEICAAYKRTPEGICNVLEEPNHPRNTQCDGVYVDFDKDGNVTWKKNARELAFYRAFSIQAFKKGVEVVVDEMKNTNVITVTPSSALYPLARGTLGVMYANYKGNIGRNKSTIDRICKATNGPAGSVCSSQQSDGSLIAAELMQVDCRLASTRSYIETAFMKFALTKAFNEASLRYYMALGQVTPRTEEYMKKLEAYIDDQDCWSEGCAMDAAKKYWKNGELRRTVFEPIMRSPALVTPGTYLLPKQGEENSCGSRAQNGLGTQGASTGPAPSSTAPRTAEIPWELFFGGMIGLRRRRRPRRKSSGAAMLVLAITLLGTAGSIGCGGGDPPEIPYPPPPDHNPDPLDNLDGAAGAGRGAQAANEGAKMEQGNLDKLTGKGNVDPDSGPGPMAAGAADTGGSGQVMEHGGREPSGGPSGPQMPKVAQQGGGGGGGGFGGGGGGSMKMGGDTGPSTAPAKQDKMAAKVEDVPGALYQGGGGGKKGAGKGGPGGPNPFAAFMGARTKGENAAGGGDISFGEDAGGMVNPMGSQDPEDYFARINPWESIFKIVERRYRQQTGGWALQESEALMQGRMPASAPQKP